MEKKNKIIIVLLIILLVLSIGFIIYDKLLSNKPDCRECTLTRCVFDEELINLKTCTIDMADKTEVYKEQIDEACGEYFFGNLNREVVIKNVKVKDEVKEVRYVYEGLNPDQNERIVKIYVNNILFEIHKAIYSNVLENISIKNDFLVLTESSYTDVPAMVKIYDIYGESGNKDAKSIDY